MCVGATFIARFDGDRSDQTWKQCDVPFEAEARVLALDDGEVSGRPGIFAGRHLHLGASDLLWTDGIKVSVISDRSQTADPMMFGMYDLDIADARTVRVKSRRHFRASFLPWFPPGNVNEMDTAGLTSLVLERWPLENIPRPSFPLDQDHDWSP